MTILVFGKTGQVAAELAMLPDTHCVGRDEADLTDPKGCAALITASAPKAVVNAAAYTAVDKAETDIETAQLVNTDAPAAMAKTCASLGIPFVHISTDYVFDGKGDAPWTPADGPNPQNVYGRTKLAGERAVRGAGGPYAVLRTSWVFSAQGANFLKTMLRLGRERDALTIVADQIGGPTPAGEIAAACHAIALGLIEAPEKSGTYHFSGAPDCSWADFARAIFKEAGIDCLVTDIPTQDYPTPAKRPLNSRMNCDDLTDAFGIARPVWQDALVEIVATIEGAADDRS